MRWYSTLKSWSSALKRTLDYHFLLARADHQPTLFIHTHSSQQCVFAQKHMCHILLPVNWHVKTHEDLDPQGLKSLSNIPQHV